MNISRTLGSELKRHIKEFPKANDPLWEEEQNQLVIFKRIVDNVYLFAENFVFPWDNYNQMRTNSTVQNRPSSLIFLSWIIKP